MAKLGVAHRSAVDLEGERGSRSPAGLSLPAGRQGVGRPCVALGMRAQPRPCGGSAGASAGVARCARGTPGRPRSSSLAAPPGRRIRPRLPRSSKRPPPGRWLAKVGGGRDVGDTAIGLKAPPSFRRAATAGRSRPCLFKGGHGRGVRMVGCQSWRSRNPGAQQGRSPVGKGASRPALVSSWSTASSCDDTSRLSRSNSARVNRRPRG